ncbi:MAG TPA: rhomboid family intramembrane serine protease [Candidatus Sulfotelmatobacter sp.]|nr:rhomboid family intramembrane serine protease [Candidatus Sulfotelmatobacter sp.]
MANCTRCGRQLPGLTFGKKICQWCVQHEAAQRGELAEDAPQPVMNVPWARSQSNISVTNVLLIANVMVFIAMVIASGPSLDFTGQVMVHFGANFGPFTLSGQWWRLLTYMFLHGGLMHIAFNMWCLWDLGALCESLYGRWTYAAIYFVTGIAAGLTSVGWNPGVLSVGASGAIFGLAGALIASFYLGEFSVPRVAIQGTLRSLLFFVGFNVFFGSVVSGIDNACHAGGLISGLIVGALIARLAPQPDRPMRRVGVLLFMVLIIGGSALGVHRWRGSGIHFGSMAETQKNLDRAIGELQKKVQKNPSDASAHYALAHAYFARGESSDGTSELKRVVDLQPQNTEARLELGAAYLNRGQPKDAQDEFVKVVEEEPNNSAAHAALGVAFAEQNDHEAAITQYKTALRLEPQVPGVNYRMGVSQSELKQYDDAIASFLKEKQIGDDAALENALADAYQAKGLTQQAQEARNKAAQLGNGQRD